jgi:PAS domain S-box-containing protein
MAKKKQYAEAGTVESLLEELEALKERLRESDETLEAIRSGAVDAILVSGKTGEQVYTLQGADQSYRLLVESVSEGIVTLSLDGTILYSNKQFADMLGYSLERIIGSPFSKFISKESKHIFAEALHSRGVKSPRFQAFLVSFSSERIPVQITLSASGVSREGTLTAVITDLSEQLRYQEIVLKEKELRESKEKLDAALASMTEQAEKLEDANRELESFSYSVSHDLKAPLRAIDGYSKMILKKHGDHIGEDAMRMLGVIRTSTERMNRLIDDLLSFSRVLKNTMTIAEIDLNSLAGEVWDDMQAARQDQEIELKVAKLQPGFGDRGLIRQVLFNLIANAVKFTRDKKPGVIEMSCYTEPGQIIYALKDNGIGFDMKYYEKLFRVFQRLHSPEEYDGTGVGLAIVSRIIKRHGGRVWAEGETDKGACFYFSLPIRNK